LLMLAYPAYMWCVFGGFVIIWLVSLLILYAYFRIVRAENRARISSFESLETCIKLATSLVESIKRPEK